MALVQASINHVVFPGCDNLALSGIELVIEPGEFIVITGPVASGKSVLCHCLTGAVPQFFPANMDGCVIVDGKTLETMPLPQIAGTVGYMMQDPQSQIFSITIAEDVAFGPGNLKKSRAEIEELVEESLQFVGLKEMGERSPETLSGGEAQRAVLAGVLALKPKLLVLDQPTAELDPTGRKDIFSRLGQLCQREQTTIVVVSDQLAELAPYATRYLVMKSGQIISDSSQNSSARQSSRPDPKRPLYLEYNPGVEIASLQACTYIYPGGQLGCQEVNLRLHQGELVVLLGVNGSGKSTVARHFNGLVRPSRGSLRVLGKDLRDLDLSALRQQVGFLFQNPDYQIFTSSVEEEVGFALRIRKIPAPEIKERVETVLGFTDLLPLRSLHPQRLSHGQRQLLALASILVGDPPLIIADEPTAGLSREAAETIIEHLAMLAAQGRTVLWITHDLELAARFAHRLLAMHRQKLLLDIPVRHLAEHRGLLAEIGLDFTGLDFNGGDSGRGGLKHGVI